MKKLTYILTAVAMAAWVAFRFAAIGSENERYVFNVARAAADQGAPVEVLDVALRTGVLKEPLHIKNNRAWVSSARVGKFRAGQKVGGGEIVSVGTGVDLDSGMHVVRTKGAGDGLAYVDVAARGYFVPVHAVAGGHVMVAEDGVAQKRSVSVSNQDSDMALVDAGLRDGDVVILSKVSDGDRVKIIR
jgi:hypothetical protein